MISKEQLDAWAKLAEEATEGPWEAIPWRPEPDDPEHEQWGIFWDDGAILEEGKEFANNAKFIAAAREAVPRLIAEIKRLHDVLDEWVP